MHGPHHPPHLRLVALERNGPGGVWLALLAPRPSRPVGGHFPSWLAAIAGNKAIGTIRRARRRPVGVSFDVEPECGGDLVSRCEADEVRGRVWSCSALARLE